ncbi:MAG: PQQ-dependent sugar dehydrogenase [Ignavibacteriaceae bacterium]
MNEKKYFTLVILLLISSFVHAQTELIPAFPDITFEGPVDLQHAGDGSSRLFVVEQSGRIKVFENSSTATTTETFLDITDRVTAGGEMGLLGLAFHPDYENNGYFYVNYTKTNPRETRISRFQVTSDPNSADPESEEILLTFTQPVTNHNGGQTSFGPDGYLYIATGDGGSGGDPDNNAQNLMSLLGKILRIDVDNTQDSLNYAIPDDNPFVGAVFVARDEIYAYGMRNPWRFSFDSSGKLWCADVGQNEWEEIDTIQKGGNYGWRIMEGTHCYNPASNCDTSGLILPIYEYSHSSNGGSASVTGGFVYEGSAVTNLRGKYIFADYVSRRVWSLIYSGANPDIPVVELVSTAPAGITSFGVDENDELYLCGSNGTIYKFASTVSVDEGTINPEKYTLLQNYPNPFNPSTTIRYNLPEDSNVKIELVNSLGEIVSVLTSDFKSRGNHTYNLNAGGLSSGIYYVRMSAQSVSSSKSFMNAIKVVFMK